MRAARRAWLAAALGLALAMAAAGCGPENASPSNTNPSGSAPSDSTPPAASSTPTNATVAPPTTPTGAVVVDPTLLDHVPKSIAGIPLEPDPATAGQIAADPSLGETARALAVARAVNGANEDDLVVVSVVELRPGVFTDAFYTAWRATYDEAACAPAGGLSESKEQTIGGRTAFVGTCAGGARTYHAHVGDDILVSALAIGRAGLGEELVAGIR